MMRFASLALALHVFPHSAASTYFESVGSWWKAPKTGGPRRLGANKKSKKQKETAEDKDLDDFPIQPIPSPCINQISGRYRFLRDEYLCSGEFKFGLDVDGDLGIWYLENKLWSAGTDGAEAHLRLDGDFVVLDSDDRDVQWRSKTDGKKDNGASSITLGEDGSILIQNPTDEDEFFLIEPDLTEVVPSVTPSSSSTPTSIPSSSMIPTPVASSPPSDLPTDVPSTSSLPTSAASNYPSHRPTIAPSISTVPTPSPSVSQSRAPSELPSLSIPPSIALGCVAQDLSAPVVLRTGEFLCSPSGRYWFGMTAEGDLVLLDESVILWSANTGNGGATMRLQRDGNLVVYSDSNAVLFATNTRWTDENIPSLWIGDDGKAGILRDGIGIVWSTTLFAPTSAPLTSPSMSISPSFDKGCVDGDPVAPIILQLGAFLCSSSEQYRFGMNDSGNLVLFDGLESVWEAGTAGDQGSRMHLQRDGNLVVYSSTDDVLFSTATQREAGNNSTTSLFVSDYGAAWLERPGDGILWSTSIFAPSSSPSETITETPPGFNCVQATASPLILDVGEFVCSQSYDYRFGLLSTGELAVLDTSDSIVWSTGYLGNTLQLHLEVDGNLSVIDTSDGESVFQSDSSDSDGGNATILVGEDGIASVYLEASGHVWSTATAFNVAVDSTTLDHKVMAGYQGWFFTPEDGRGINRWNHWSKPDTSPPNPDTVTVDMWPDLREYESDELYPTPFIFSSGVNASVFSSHNTKTVERHTRWMQEYGIDGIFAQRFIADAVARTDEVDQVLMNIRSGAEKYGRVFVNMYDISNGINHDLVTEIISDWKHLVDDLLITKSNQYLWHRDKPLVAVWGLGFIDRIGEIECANELLDFFNGDPEERYQATVFGGVPAGWRDLSRDSKMAEQWAQVFRRFDVLSPWTIGRFRNVDEADKFLDDYVKIDMVECEANGIDYMPVAYPGFSSNNLNPEKPFNHIPRNGGTFFWRQLHNIASSGNSMIYIAMFDEIDEATAIFKVSESIDQIPTTGQFLTVNSDPGFDIVPSDWYLQLTGEITRFVHIGETNDIPLEMPKPGELTF